MYDSLTLLLCLLLPAAPAGFVAILGNSPMLSMELSVLFEPCCSLLGGRLATTPFWRPEKRLLSRIQTLETENW